LIQECDFLTSFYDFRKKGRKATLPEALTRKVLHSLIDQISIKPILNVRQELSSVSTKMNKRIPTLRVLNFCD
jgi:hypothetical protein